MDIQQLAIKVFAKPGSFDQARLIPIFHNWIRERRLGDVLLVDVADYRHVPHGPGVMLIGHEAHWGLDEGGGRPGMLHARKRDAAGDARTRLREGFRAALLACDALEKEPSVAGGIAFDPGQVEVRIFSRLVVPNTAETYAAFAPVLEGFVREVYAMDGGMGEGSGAVMLEHLADPRQAFGVRVQVAGAPSAGTLLERIPG